jgi:hypothetical protein
MAKESSRRQIAHQARLKAAGVKHVSLWLPPELQTGVGRVAQSAGISQHAAILRLISGALELEKRLTSHAT